MSDLLARTRTSELTVWPMLLLRFDSRKQHGSALLSRMRLGGVAPVSTNGVLGDPSGASAQEGLGLLFEHVCRCRLPGAGVGAGRSGPAL